jgi:hypothetical protein
MPQAGNVGRRRISATINSVTYQLTDIMRLSVKMGLALALKTGP